MATNILGLPNFLNKGVANGNTSSSISNLQSQLAALVPSSQTTVAAGRRANGSILTMSDDNEMLGQIQTTHAPDGRKFEVKILFTLVENILRHASLHAEASLTVSSQLQLGQEDKIQTDNQLAALLDALSFTIERVSVEIRSKALDGADAHATALSIFKILSGYSWEAKLVLTLAAFAVNYGEFWLLAQIYSSNPLAKSVATLKQLPVILEHSEIVKPRFEQLNILITSIMNVTKRIVEFIELQSKFVSQQLPAVSKALSYVPTAVYWNIRSVLACATQITNLTTIGHESVLSTAETWELSTLTHKLTTIHESIREQFDVIHLQIDEKRTIQTFELLVSLFETIHMDNTKILKTFFSLKEDIQPFFNFYSKTEATIEVLRSKNVLLLVSSIEVSHLEILNLRKIYDEFKSHDKLSNQYEIVWLPVLDTWTELDKKKFESLQAEMPWYTVSQPWLIEKAVIKFTKEKWSFKDEPMLVVLDPQGRVTCQNAFHMIWVWGSKSFPFTRWREEALWREETWSLDLLISGTDEQSILNWVEEDRYILLYGGDDIDFVRKFTQEARNVAQQERITIELVYVGKSNKRKQVEKVIQTITEEKLSHCSHNLIKNFWIKLESMLFSMFQLGKADGDDVKMLEIKKLLSYDKEGAWAVLSKGSNIIVNGYGSILYSTFKEYNSWKENAATNGFELSFKEYYGILHASDHPCYRLEFPIGSKVPEHIHCPECHHIMKKFNTFRCCHEETTPQAFIKALTYE